MSNLKSIALTILEITFNDEKWSDDCAQASSTSTVHLVDLITNFTCNHVDRSLLNVSSVMSIDVVMSLQHRFRMLIHCRAAALLD